MKNVSLDKEPIELKVGVKYIIIDGLYINDIRQAFLHLDLNNILQDIRNKVFLYTDTPFGEYTANDIQLTINRIRKVKYNEISKGEKSVFSTDTGLIIFINEKYFEKFISKFDFEKLIDSSIDMINIHYWESVANEYDLADIALIVSPGIGFGIEFEGSGTFRVS